MPKDDKKDHDTIPSAPPVEEQDIINEIFSIGDLVKHLSQFDQTLPISFSSQFIQHIDGNDKQCLVRNFLLDPLEVKIITSDSGEEPPFAIILTDIIEEWTDVANISECDCEECNKCDECQCEDVEDDESLDTDVDVPYTTKKFLLN
jgi:hypothetical protein